MVVRPSRIVFAAALVASFASAETARADDDSETSVVEILEGIGAAAAVIGDVVFTSYDIGTAADNHQPDKGWMIAETSFGVPETAGTYIYIIAKIQDPAFEKSAPLLIPITMAASSITTHGIWSIASDRLPPGPRLGASWLIGTDFAFTAISLSETLNGKLLPKPIALAEMLIMTPEAVVGGVAAAKDPTARGGWIAIAGWSGVLAVHGLVSFLAGVANVQPPVKAPPQRSLPPPDPEPPPAGGAPTIEEEAPPVEPAPAPSPPPRPFAGMRPVVVPAAITDGVAVVPGAVVVGVF